MIIADFLLERYNLGEVTPEEQARVEGAYGEAIAAKLASLRESDAQIREQYLRGRARPFARRAHSRKRRTGAARSIAIAAAIAALVAVTAALSVYRGNFALSRTVAVGERPKGGTAEQPQLLAYLKTGGEPLLLPDGMHERVTLHNGDTIQLAYTAAEAAYGVIFSVDGRRTVTLHYPYTETGGSLLEAGQNTALAEAYTLDDAPFFETFFLITSNTPIDAAAILEKARQTAAGTATGAIEQAVQKLFNGNKYEVVWFRVDK